MNIVQSLEAPLTEKELINISRIQRFVFKCISMFKYGHCKNIENHLKFGMMENEAERIFIDTEWQITFDETIWMPTDKTAYGNIIKICIKETAQSEEFAIYNIDLRKDYHDCVSFYIGDRVNIFDVTFKDNVNTST